jgi:hypothetical protein
MQGPLDQLMGWLRRTGALPAAAAISASSLLPVPLDLLMLAQDDPELAMAVQQAADPADIELAVRGALGMEAPEQRVRLRPTTALITHASLQELREGVMQTGPHLASVSGVVQVLSQSQQAIHSRVMR